jgi:beta-glucosidase
MGAIAHRYGTEESAVLAVEAGADILLMPLDPEKAIQAVCAAVESGRISPERIQASLERIWRAKLKVCSPPIAAATPHAWENISPSGIETPAIVSRLAQPDAIDLNAQILKDSMQVHSRLGSFPKDGRNLILVDDGIDCDFLDRTAPAIVTPRQFGFTQVQVVDRHTPKICFNFDLKDSQPTLLQLFIRGNPFRGSAGLTQTAQDWFDFLRHTQQLQGLVIYGSPYVLEQFLPTLPSGVPYVFTYGQMHSAQAIALETLFS